LFLTDPYGKKLKHLKETLVLYFTLKQRGPAGAIDPRYLPWFVGLLESYIFPENVRILSWNYDFQVQLAISQIMDLEKNDVVKNITVYKSSRFKSYPFLDYTEVTFEELMLAQLNGLGSISQIEKGKYKCLINCTTQNFYNDLYSDLIGGKLTNSINFAWERSESDSKTLTNSFKKMIEGVSILVVIGYSFPFYNRKIDKSIFKMLTASNQLKKIYYQDPFLDGKQLVSQFELNESLAKNIVHIKQTDNFHIPFEY